MMNVAPADGSAAAAERLQHICERFERQLDQLGVSMIEPTASLQDGDVHDLKTVLAELAALRSFVGDESFASDYQTVGQMRGEINRLRAFVESCETDVSEIAKRLGCELSKGKCPELRGAICLEDMLGALERTVGDELRRLREGERD